MIVFPPWLQIVMSALLGVSVTMNVALILHNHALQKLRREILELQQKDRHDLRNDLGAVSLQLGALRLAYNQLVSMKYPSLLPVLGVKEPE